MGGPVGDAGAAGLVEDGGEAEAVVQDGEAGGCRGLVAGRLLAQEGAAALDGHHTQTHGVGLPQTAAGLMLPIHGADHG